MIQYSLFTIHRLFFFLLIVFLPTQLGYHVWPEWSSVLGRRVDFLSPTLFGSDILIVGTVLMWLIEYLFLEKSIKGSVLGIKGNFFSLNTLYLILISSFIYINILRAASWQVSLFFWVKFFEYLLLFFYIVKTKPSMRLLSFGLMIGIVYSSGIAIVQFLLQHSLGGIFWFLGERTFSVDTPGIARFPLCLSSFFGCIEFLRSYATFPHPNVLAGYLAVGIPLLVNYPIVKLSNSQIIQSTKKYIDKLSIFRKIAIILGFVALLVTFSRSAVLVLVLYGLLRIIQFYYFDKFHHMNSEYRILNAVFMIHASVFKKMTVLFIFLFCAVGLYALRSVSPFDESVVVRQELMTSAWTLFQSSPLFGIGLGNFIVRLPDVLTAHSVYFLQPVHNIYLLILSEIGIVGVTFFLLFGFYLLNIELRILNTGESSKLKVQNLKLELKNQKGFSTIHYSLLRPPMGGLRTGTALFTILVLGLVDHYWLTLQQGQLLFVVVMGYSLIHVKGYAKKY